MIQVKNKKAISDLSYKSLKMNRTRNLIAILAIALTTILFTALFTIAGTIVHSYQQETFRQVGGDFHGSFKDITEDQLNILSKDSLISKSGARLILGMPYDPPFNKVHVEVSYMDKTCAKGSFCTPEYGTLPAEGSKQIACDTRVLKLLGVEPKIGASLTLTYYMGSSTDSPKAVTDTFTLSGWWTYDEAIVANQVLVPLSYAKQALAEYTRKDLNDTTGTWTLNIYFKNAANIEKNLNTILEHSGYQMEEQQADNYIKSGVNWAYMGAQFSQNADIGTILAIFMLLILIIFTGYLIIYNIFQISVTNDIRFYGLLKTIGTTGKQIRRLILRQALLLSVIGIPIGLVIGYLCGNMLTPVIMSTLSYKNTFTTINPVIFISASAFSLITVLISCRRPGKIAGKVSPVEAVRYTENTHIKKNTRKSRKANQMFHMALSNLSRNLKKTILVVLSLALSVVLLQITVTFTNGFDMEKYLNKFVVSDFIVGNANYFQVNSISFGEDTAVPETVIGDMNAQDGIRKSGRIYGTTNLIKEFVSKDWYRQNHGQYTDEQVVNQMLESEEETSDGKVTDNIHLYGMEDFPLDLLTVIDGDLAPLHDPDQNAIAAVYENDDYNNLEQDSHWAKVGDQVTLRYIEEWEYYDIRTGEVWKDADSIDYDYMGMKATKYHDVTYTVTALITMRSSMSYRYYGSDAFVLNAKVFQRDTNSSNIMTYLYNTTKESNTNMEKFLADYTENVEPTMDYESKQSYVKEFGSFRSMFLLLGSVLSGIIGLVGILNFLNGVLTSILTRKREFAMLQSIGMTGKQLKRMLVYEGVLYTLFAIGISLALSLLTGPLLNKTISSLVWFFTYRFTLLPVLIAAPVFLLLGILLPLIIYRFTVHQTIIERLRNSD